MILRSPNLSLLGFFKYSFYFSTNISKTSLGYSSNLFLLTTNLTANFVSSLSTFAKKTSPNDPAKLDFALLFSNVVGMYFLSPTSK